MCSVLLFCARMLDGQRAKQHGWVLHCLVMISTAKFLQLPMVALLALRGESTLVTSAGALCYSILEGYGTSNCAIGLVCFLGPAIGIGVVS